MHFLGNVSGKESAHQCRRCKRFGLEPWLGRSPGGGNGNPSGFLPEKSYDSGAWWASVHGVAESDTTDGLSRHTRLRGGAEDPVEEQNVQ